VVGGCAANHLLLPLNSLNNCHSERSEESHTFNRTVIINLAKITQLTIADISLGDYPLFLAPMEDITDPSFRMVCKINGADVMYTEFISSDGLIRDGEKSIRKLDIYDFERPIGIQLYGHITEAMTEAALMAEEAKPELIDINFGCPVKKIANRGAGAGMLRNIPLMLKMTEAIVKAVKLPVTVKTRFGWDEESKNIVDVAERLQDTGIKALTIHGRTRAQMYKGAADWTLIGEVKNNPRMKIPIIGNGDIDSPQTAREMFDRYGVDGIMIGRATVGRPWIFRDIKHFLNTGDLLPEPSVSEKAEIALMHLDKSLEFKEGRRAIFEMRRHLSNYFKGLPHFKETRLKLLTALEPDDIKIIIGDIRNQWGDFRSDDRTSVYGI
jgi:tRNA-dihydrouridine synthase B